MKQAELPVKIIIGTDVSKSELVSRVGFRYSDQTDKLGERKTFANTPEGFKSLWAWKNKQTGKTDVPVWFVMETTGVYHESFAWFLKDHQAKVAIIVPRQMKHFQQSTSQKSKTDQLDADVITRFGLERNLKDWKTESLQMRQFKQLSREIEQIKKARTTAKNQLSALCSSYDPNSGSIKRLKELIRMYDDQIKAINTELSKQVDTSKELRSNIERITTIPGVGLTTAISVIAETYGFSLIENQRQLISYAGLDVKHNDSGTKRGKTEITKSGNNHLRKALYFPALVAIKFNPVLENLYNRIMERTKIKMVGVVAVMRKLLILIFTIWKKETTFNFNHSNFIANIG